MSDRTDVEGTLYLREPAGWNTTKFVPIEDMLGKYGRERIVKMLREAADSIEKDGTWR